MKPIIKSLLDMDEYCIGMSNLVYLKNHSDIQVKYAFTNRTTSINLANWIKPYDLQEQFEYICGLKFTDDEINWLKSKNKYSNDFLDSLKNIELSKPKVIIEGESFKGIEVSGEWISTLLWETMVLSVVNQLFNQKYMKYMGSKVELFDDDMMLKGVSNLEKKIELLEEHPEVNFSDFGTRRRFSTAHHGYIIKRLIQEIPNQIVGTSNLMYAKKYNIHSIGTISHGLPMVYAALYEEDLISAQEALLNDWYDVYGGPGSIFLPDTFGTDFFLRNLSMKNIVDWWGHRVDSGNPFSIGDKIINHYKSNGVDPIGKMLLFSDGLTVEKMIELDGYFDGKIETRFGIGTSMTNDIGGQPLSIVLKAIECEEKKLIKLSDNISKCIGDPETIERYKKIVGYENKFDEQPTY